MNALQRDLKKLVPLVESLGKETIAADPTASGSTCSPRWAG